jgi:hypothetical protein
MNNLIIITNIKQDFLNEIKEHLNKMYKNEDVNIHIYAGDIHNLIQNLDSLSEKISEELNKELEKELMMFENKK